MYGTGRLTHSRGFSAEGKQYTCLIIVKKNPPVVYTKPVYVEMKYSRRTSCTMFVLKKVYYTQSLLELAVRHCLGQFKNVFCVCRYMKGRVGPVCTCPVHRMLAVHAHRLPCLMRCLVLVLHLIWQKVNGYVSIPFSLRHLYIVGNMMVTWVVAEIRTFSI